MEKDPRSGLAGGIIRKVPRMLLASGVGHAAGVAINTSAPLQCWCCLRKLAILAMDAPDRLPAESGSVSCAHASPEMGKRQ